MTQQGSDTSHLICAIVTPNYLSQFLILGRSLAIAIPSAVVRILGFCSARFSALPFLDWWSERLQFDCLVDPTAGYFTDQRILDLAPLKARVQIVQEPGCNVAYWNLHEREVVLDQGEWKVTFDESTHPLYFFHFSGFRLHRSPSLSIHASRRVLGKSLPRAFAVQYDEMLQQGRTHHQDVEFTLGGATPHEPIPTEWRRCCL